MMRPNPCRDCCTPWLLEEPPGARAGDVQRFNAAGDLVTQRIVYDVGKDRKSVNGEMVGLLHEKRSACLVTLRSVSNLHPSATVSCPDSEQSGARMRVTCITCTHVSD
jgi:hypothetical protein